MSSIPSRFGRTKFSQQPQKSDSVKSGYSRYHATVNCHECNRIMVPRVITYYGQAQKSICPFCGTTFMKFPSGLQRLLQRFHTRTLSFSIFKQLTATTLCFGFIWFLSTWGYFPEIVNFVATIGTIIFAVMAGAELIVQSVEHLAELFSHESNHYWAGITLIAVTIANFDHELIDYILLFFSVMLIRWIIFGLVQVFLGNRLNN